MKIVKQRGSLIIHKPRLNTLKVFTQPSSVGAPKMKTQIKRREPAHSRAASGLVYARRPYGGGSLSLRNQLENKGAPPCFKATRKLSCAWVGVLHAEWNPHNTQRRLTTQESPCIEITKLPVAQDQGHNASAKLSGATSTWEMRSQH